MGFREKSSTRLTSCPHGRRCGRRDGAGAVGAAGSLMPRMLWGGRRGCHWDCGGSLEPRVPLGCGGSRPPDAPALFGAVGAWQDPRAVHDLRGPRSEKGPFLARSSRHASPNDRLRGFSDAWREYLAEASSFWIHGGDMLPRTGAFPSEAPSGTHEAKKLPRIAARKHTTAISCHCRTLGNAFREHFVIGKRPGTHHGIILPRLDARPASHGTERPTAPAGLIAKHHAMHRTRRFCRH